MTALLRQVLGHFPRVKLFLRFMREHLLFDKSVSSGYREIPVDYRSEEADRLRTSWQSELIPMRQRELVDRQLADYRQGKPIDVFDVMVAALGSLDDETDTRSLLEIGCSSGFYSEVLKIKKLPFLYSGCDYSPAFIKMGMACYPDMPFTVQDATALNFEDQAFDVVVSGCCLLHITEYEKAIAETARVARQYVIFHRTPVVTGLPHQYFRKQAYGVETVEIHFNEPQLLDLIKNHGLVLMNIFTLSMEQVPVLPNAWRFNRTYLFRKITHAA